MRDGASDLLRRWRAAGLLTPEQVEAIELFEAGRPAGLALPGPPPAPPPAPIELPARPAASWPVPAPPPGPTRPVVAPARVVRARRSRFNLPDPETLRGRSGARWLALVLGILAALGLMGATLSFVTDILVAPGRLLTADAEESIHLVASVVGLFGALALYRTAPFGKPLVVLGLVLNIAATLLFSARTLTDALTLVPMLTWIVLLVLTLAVRRDPALRPTA